MTAAHATLIIKVDTMTSEVEARVDLQEPVRDFFEEVKPLLGRPPYGSLEFELQSPIGEKNRKRLVELMLSLPGDLGYQQFRVSSNLRQISDDAATHKALETMYLGPSNEETEDSLLWSRLHMENIHNSMAVRNRLRIVKREFESHMVNLIQKGKEPIQVLSIAAGSSRAIMETVASLNGRGFDRLRLQLVDLNREALEDGRNLANQLGIEECIQFTRAHYASFRRYLPDGYHPDFVEVVGLLDYLPPADVAGLLATVRSHLSDAGVIIYSNIAPNQEREFTHKIVGWPQMHYRNSRQLLAFAEEAGLRKAELLKEPLGIYNSVIAGN